LGAASRQKFPAEEDERDYNNILVFVALGFLGSTVGGSFPLIPTWMGASGGAGAFVFFATWPTAQGDLVRTLGMRIVTLVRVLLDLNQELRLVNKAGAVSSNLLDKMLILDRKHRIKDKVISGATFVYEQVMAQVNNRQEASGGGRRRMDRRRDGAGERRRGRDDRRDDDEYGDRQRRGRRQDGSGRRPRGDEDEPEQRDEDRRDYKRRRPSGDTNDPSREDENEDVKNGQRQRPRQDDEKRRYDSERDYSERDRNRR